MKDDINHNSLEAFTAIAYRCLNKNREERPLMEEVVRILEAALECQANEGSLALKLSGTVYSSQLEVYKLEEESSFFNKKYLADKVLAGEWHEAERYVSRFTKVDDNRYSMKIFFELRKQNYLEALDRKDRSKAVEILINELKIFSSFSEELYKELTMLITLENIREHEQLALYGDVKTTRQILLNELIRLVDENPLIGNRDPQTEPTHVTDEPNRSNAVKVYTRRTKPRVR